MNAIAAKRIPVSVALAAQSANDDRNPMAQNGKLLFDPLNDDVNDEVVGTTNRALSRVVLVAGESAGRFRHGRIGRDPSRPMSAPRSVLVSAAAIEGCLDRNSCTCSILCHGSDAGRSAIDGLLVCDGEDVFDEYEFNHPRGGGTASANRSGRRASDRSTGMRSFSAKIAGNRENSRLQELHASLPCKALREGAHRQFLTCEPGRGPHSSAPVGIAVWCGMPKPTFRVSWSLPFADATVRDRFFGWLATRVHSLDGWGELAFCEGSEALTQLRGGLVLAKRVSGGWA